ncbi:MAG: tRNA (guanosine(37)-N1)-methyltransferase TrmD [bacterium]|nr:tRNA (guanosine(37)-N1)-methyltransferase TrmD [bacterium]
MNYHIISLFPQSFDSYLSESILKRAKEDKLINVNFYNPRDFAMAGRKTVQTYSERRVDDKPYGGGPGMVIEALPVIRAIEKAVKKAKSVKIQKGKSVRGKILKKTKLKIIKNPKIKIIFFSPSGKKFTNEYAEATSKKFTDIIMVCGRYEGIDARIKKVFKMEDVSIGDYVLTGGEIPAMILIDSISRRIKGVLGDHSSLEDTRIASSDVYTRPEVIEYKGKKLRVPKVLLSGNHKLIDEWRTENNLL